MHDSGTTQKLDSKLVSVVERMFDRCFDHKQYRQAIGIALESRRLDVIERALRLADEADESVASYILSVAMSLVQNLAFRNKVLQLCLDYFLKPHVADYFSAVTCIVHLNDSSVAAKLLSELLRAGDDRELLKAYQIAFDLESSATQEFLAKTIQELSPLEKAGDSTEKSAEATGETAGETTDTKSVPASPEETIRRILSGDETIKIYLEFLSKNNNCDTWILKETKDALESRSSIFHSAVTFANAFMNAGTMSDDFFRTNLEWLSRATNWSKFAATAALGAIHKGNLSQSMSLLSPYLPKDNVSRSVYSEGGSLYALGLIYANHGSSIMGFLKDQLTSHEDEVIQHGACLGLGVAGMATGDEEIYDTLKEVLFSDKAVAGEAAALSMGLIMLGTGSERAIEEMITYAHETQHEKIVRGLALGVALLLYAKEESADATIKLLSEDADPLLRYGGMFAIALAYAGTGNNKAIKKLLHFGVSDVSDNVRRAAVMGFGFVMFRDPKSVPPIIELLVDSYNPHVRYGAAMALGISCVGSALPSALVLLDTLSKDNTDFVRQAAMIATAMVLMQHNDQSSGRVDIARKMFEKSISAKHEDAMAKFGATLAQGIMDAGGRNVTIGLQSSSLSSNMSAIVGMALFTQYWYWFPLAHFLVLSFTPTGFLGLNKDLKAPNFEIVSNARPSLFAYPPMTKPLADKKVEKVETAVLSTTAKAQARAKRNELEKEAKEKTDAMDQDVSAAEGEPAAAGSSAKEAAGPGDEKLIDVEMSGTNAESSRKRDEPRTQNIPNFSRVVPSQLQYITMKPDSRYHPVAKVRVWHCPVAN